MAVCLPLEFTALLRLLLKNKNCYMTLAEKMKNEQDNSTSVFLHREGLFWKAYEYSAYLFVRDIRAYNPQKKEVKSLKTHVVSLGFPDQVLGEILKGRDHDAHGDKCMEIKGFQPVEMSGYEQWKNNLPLAVSNPTSTGIGNGTNDETGKETGGGTGNGTKTGSERTVLARLRSFRTEASSPLQCLMFVSELQKELSHDVR